MTELPKIPGFHVGARLGAGSFGTVYAGVALDTGLDVAIKILRVVPDTTEHRFAREVRSLARLAWHPNIVQIISAGELGDGASWFAMERLGAPLTISVPTGAQRLADIGIQLAGALTAAHAAGLIHRDVKPSNILTGPEGVVKLADFGIVADLGGSGTSLADMVGTWQFMAPEVFEGEQANELSDQYSLGASLCALAVGAVPFAAARSTTAIGPLLRAKQDNRHEQLRSGEVPASMVNIIERAMRPEPQDRYPTLNAFAADLAELQRVSGWPATRHVASRGLDVSPSRTGIGAFTPPLFPSRTNLADMRGPDALAMSALLEPLSATGDTTVLPLVEPGGVAARSIRSGPRRFADSCYCNERSLDRGWGRVSVASRRPREIRGASDDDHRSRSASDGSDIAADQ